MQSGRTLLNSGARTFLADTDEWGLTPSAGLAITLFPLIVVGVVAVIAVLSFVIKTPFRDVFRFVTAEDSLLEWPQFLFIFSASIIFGWLGIQFVRQGQQAVGLVYLLLALGAFFVAGEEISWGQRIFGWSTPDTLDAINHQGETNVHNIRWVQTAFGYVLLLGAAYGTLAPIAEARFWRGPARPALNFLFIPPLCAVPAFLMPFGYKLFRTLIWPGTDFTVVKFGEAPELCLYFGLLMFAWLNLRHLRVTRRETVAGVVTTP
jgi:hypothetical protein